MWMGPRLVVLRQKVGTEKGRGMTEATPLPPTVLPGSVLHVEREDLPIARIDSRPRLAVSDPTRKNEPPVRRGVLVCHDSLLSSGRALGVLQPRGSGVNLLSQVQRPVLLFGRLAPRGPLLRRASKPDSRKWVRLVAANDLHHPIKPLFGKKSNLAPRIDPVEKPAIHRGRFPATASPGLCRVRVGLGWRTGGLLSTEGASLHLEKRAGCVGCCTETPTRRDRRRDASR